MSDMPSTEGIDKVIHEPARLGIVATLAARGEMTFTELRQALDMTDGNLSVHARVLETAGYLAVQKDFVGRKPQTTLGLTAQGRKAFQDYLTYLEKIVRSGRSGGR